MVHVTGEHHAECLLRSEGPAWPGAMDRQDWQLGVASLHGPITASSELCRLMGIRQLDFGGTKEAFLQIVHEEDRDRVSQALNAILDERKPCDIDHRIILPNGGEFTVICKPRRYSMIS